MRVTNEQFIMKFIFEGNIKNNHILFSRISTLFIDMHEHTVLSIF